MKRKQLYPIKLTCPVEISEAPSYLSGTATYRELLRRINYRSYDATASVLD
jgi:hypothetical protein